MITSERKVLSHERAPVFLFFDYLDNRTRFWIYPSDGRSGAKRSIQQPIASLPNFLRTLHRLSNPMPLTGRPAEHLRGSRHAILTSSAILWFLTQKRETVGCGLATASPSHSRAGRSSREGKITASESGCDFDHSFCDW